MVDENDDVITRAHAVRARLAALRAHQTQERQRLHAIVVRDLLNAGYSYREASEHLGLSPTFVHRESQRPTHPKHDKTEFAAIDEATERYVLGMWTESPGALPPG